MAKSIIVGGGLAGLSAGIYLTLNGENIEIIEASPKFGGRTYSFYDRTIDDEIDNGQHILMGAYKETLKFLDIIGTSQLPEYQKNLKIEYLNHKGEHFPLNAPNIPYPFNLILALARFSIFNMSEKASLFKLLAKLFFDLDNFRNDGTVDEWLIENKQNNNLIENFWKVICAGALNTETNNASADLFRKLIKRIFFTGNKSSTIILPAVPLSKLFVAPAREFLNSRKVPTSLSERLLSIHYENNKAVKLETNIREIKDFDYLILAIPTYGLKNVGNIERAIDKKYIDMQTSSIITIHIWTDQKFLNGKFAGFLNSDIQWIFSNSKHYSIVISAADKHINLSNERIFENALEELKKHFPRFNLKYIESYKVIKEKRATLLSSPQNEILRKNLRSKISNIFFAGDWTNTGIPGTIEGAILSGKIAAAKILD